MRIPIAGRLFASIFPRAAASSGDPASSAQDADGERLSTESAHRDAILAAMIEGVLAVNSQLQVVFCNRALIQALGIRFEVKEGMPA